MRSKFIFKDNRRTIASILVLLTVFVGVFLSIGNIKAKKADVGSTSSASKAQGIHSDTGSTPTKNPSASASSSTSNNDMVNIKDIAPSVAVELKYATKDNITGKVIYNFTEAYLRRGTAQKIAKVQNELKKNGYSLVIWDAYRPLEAQYKLWKQCPNSRYIVDPYKSYSVHSTGGCVDVTLMRTDGKSVTMPSEFDKFTKKADRDYSDVSTQAAVNSKYLESVMVKYGFRPYANEWWHYYDTNTYHKISFNPSANSTISISAVGDCVIGGDYRWKNKKTNTFDYFVKTLNKPYSYFFSGVKEYLSTDDLTIANCECVFTTVNSPIKKPAQQNGSWWFRGKPDYVNILKDGSIEAVNIANNHCMDFGETGLEQSRNTLNSAGISCFGMGTNTIVEKKGIKIGLLSYNLKGSLEQGINEEKVKQNTISDIANLKTKTNLIIVYFHWGNESSYIVCDMQKKFGRLAIDCGADLVLGSHPHVLEPIETYKGKSIVYSLGNFCYGGSNNPKDIRTIIFKATFSFDNNKIVSSYSSIIPCLICSATNNDYRPVVASGVKADEIKKIVCC